MITYILVAATLLAKDLTVCELLKNRLTYDGKLVTLTASISFTRVSVVAVGEECEAHVVAERLEFPDIVYLAASPIEPKETWHKVEFSAPGVFKRLLWFMEQAETEARQAVCEIEGLFESREARHLWAPKIAQPRGYGPYNIAPAQLILKRLGACHLKARVRMRLFEPRLLKDVK